MMNLALNARDAMPNGGKLFFSTMNVSIMSPRLLHGDVVPPGEYIILAVRDTGTGIAPEHLKKLFDPFFTTKSQAGGTGLGLSTVYGAVREMGGYLQITTGLASGTTFEVWMPRSKNAATITRCRERLPKGQTGAILVVEDEPVSRRALSQILKLNGFSVTAMGTADEALESIHDHPDTYGTLLTDCSLPGMSGRELARNVHSSAPEIRIILMSGYDQEQSTHDLSDTVEYLSKPFSPQTLLSILRCDLKDACR